MQELEQKFISLKIEIGKLKGSYDLIKRVSEIEDCLSDMGVYPSRQEVEARLSQPLIEFENGLRDESNTD